ncbi:hypothetical protein E4T50_05736 [Aureobasidium sp. EXF-12298]|nr:hypothetical protein E4T50_05736 [Aureobasidium sp. EXF-12298]KAI4752672.1 hypothetical protein E4T51_14161 [Aureobasidium sp. EXF-12344]KAI4782694.1 hypothetical protein E4T52_02361 [Aureobasidium sp. EXF-3400]
MANESILTYLPSGWTEERYKNATDDDWETLSEEEAELLLEREIAEKEASSKATRQSFKNTMMARAEAAGAPPPQFPSETDQIEPPPQHHALVEMVEKNNWEDFGFVAFRTYFGDEQLWEQFRDLWDPLLQHGFDVAPRSKGLDRVRDRLLVKIVDDEMTDGVNAEGVASAYRLFTEDEEEVNEDERLEPGLKTRMCLFVDEQCMRSVTTPSPSTPPYVKVVDVGLGSTTQQRPGAVSRVAIKDLVTHFYPALWLSDIADIADLRPLKEDQVWSRLSLSVYGSVQQEQLHRAMGIEQ